MATVGGHPQRGTHGFVCASCGRRSAHLTRLGALRRAVKHAQEHAEHMVFLLNRDKATLENVWFPEAKHGVNIVSLFADSDWMTDGTEG